MDLKPQGGNSSDSSNFNIFPWLIFSICRILIVHIVAILIQLYCIWFHTIPVLKEKTFSIVFSLCSMSNLPLALYLEDISLVKFTFIKTVSGLSTYNNSEKWIKKRGKTLNDVTLKIKWKKLFFETSSKWLDLWGSCWIKNCDIDRYENFHRRLIQ